MSTTSRQITGNYIYSYLAYYDRNVPAGIFNIYIYILASTAAHTPPLSATFEKVDNILVYYIHFFSDIILLVRTVFFLQGHLFFTCYIRIACLNEY